MRCVSHYSLDFTFCSYILIPRKTVHVILVPELYIYMFVFLEKIVSKTQEDDTAENLVMKLYRHS